MPHKLAIVGVGKIARDQHIPAIAANPELEIAATASRNPAATVPGIPAYPTLSDLLAAHSDIPCVSLCTPPQARYLKRRGLV